MRRYGNDVLILVTKLVDVREFAMLVLLLQHDARMDSAPVLCECRQIHGFGRRAFQVLMLSCTVCYATGIEICARGVMAMWVSGAHVRVLMSAGGRLGMEKII